MNKYHTVRGSHTKRNRRVKNAKLSMGLVHQSGDPAWIQHKFWKQVWLCLSPWIDLYSFGLLNRANFPAFSGGYTKPESPHIPRENDPEGPLSSKLIFINLQRDSESTGTNLIPLRLLTVTWLRTEKVRWTNWYLLQGSNWSGKCSKSKITVVPH